MRFEAVKIKSAPNGREHRKQRIGESHVQDRNTKNILKQQNEKCVKRFSAWFINFILVVTQNRFIANEHSIITLRHPPPHHNY
jgi:hypothetical protein